MYSVILCGGSGTRLWPLSRKNFPKQFLSLYSDKSLLQETYLRMREIMPKENILFITNKENFFNVYNQIREVEKDFPADHILNEPASLNTAPAIALAVKHLLEKMGADPGEPIIFLPADHYIGNQEAYLTLVKKALCRVAENGTIGTLGITPIAPETGYGYIRKGLPSEDGDFFEVSEFREKPDKATAEEYLRSGEYVWNSGMYLFSAKTFSEELRAHAPEIAAAFDESYEVFLEKFPALPSISVDYAISERSKNVIVFEGEFGWNDIGSFDSIAENFGNAKGARQISVDSKNVYVHTESDRLVAVLGVDDLNIVETADSILVQKRGRGEDVKKIVEILKESGAKEIEHNLVVHQPWGKYEILIDDPKYKAKRITVYSGAKLSLRSDFQGVEHWIVVRGKAKITRGKEAEPEFLRENESTFIPMNAIHCLENEESSPLEIIEVQTGVSFRADDAFQSEGRESR